MESSEFDLGRLAFEASAVVTKVVEREYCGCGQFVHTCDFCGLVKKEEDTADVLKVGGVKAILIITYKEDVRRRGGALDVVQNGK